MLKVALDTNVLVSATIRKGNQFQLLKLGKLGSIQIIISQDILAEVEEVLKRPRFGFSDEQITDSLSEIINIASIVNPKKKLDVIKEDPDDNAILECAIEGKADYIISGDGHLLNLKEYEGIKIRNSRDFMQETGF